MSNSQIRIENSRIRNLMRQYSGYLNQNNLQNFYPTQSSHPAQMYSLGRKSELLVNGQNARNSDVRSLIEQLMKTKDIKPSQNIEYNPAKPVLVSTEQRIFEEVVNLLIQINEIRESIKTEKDKTLQLEIEKDHLLNKIPKTKTKKTDVEMDSIINKLKSQEKQGLKVSMAQLEKFSIENEQLEKSINRLKIKDSGNPKKILENEKERYKALTAKLESKRNQVNFDHSTNFQQSQDLLNEIADVERDLERLERNAEAGNFNIGYEIKKLHSENERLRHKTIKIIESEKGRAMEQQSYEEANQRRRLQQFLEKEEENKRLFLEDLKHFKAEYESLRQQNERLRNRFGIGNNDEVVVLMEESRSQQFGDANKFYKYNDLVSEMKNVMK